MHELDIVRATRFFADLLIEEAASYQDSRANILGVIMVIIVRTYLIRKFLNNFK